LIPKLITIVTNYFLSLKLVTDISISQFVLAKIHEKNVKLWTYSSYSTLFVVHVTFVQ